MSRSPSRVYGGFKHVAGAREIDPRYCDVIVARFESLSGQRASRGAVKYGEQACRVAGISPSSYYRWLERGAEQTHGIYRSVHDAVRQAETEAEYHAVAIVRRAMADDWRAAIAIEPGASTATTGRGGTPALARGSSL
ncbi:MAG: hypothetical protein H0T69_11295 [Thermoleophilaceae bacterium]|nr:hypothetical protein [Thermoleophilaceae bacterium]